MYLLSFCFWVLLNGRFTWEVILLGLGILLPEAILLRLLFFYTPKTEWRFLRRLPLFIVYLLVLLFEILKANLKVLCIILFRKIKTNPALRTVTVDLQTDFARFMLANSITLTPGTITVSAEGNRFTVHCLSAEMLDGIEDGIFVRLLRKMEA